MMPFNNLAFNMEETAMIELALIEFENCPYNDGPRKQRQNNLLLANSALKKHRNQNPRFTAEEMRIIYVSLSYLSTLITNVLEDKSPDYDEFRQSATKDDLFVKSAILKLEAILARSGIIIP